MTRTRRSHFAAVRAVACWVAMATTWVTAGHAATVAGTATVGGGPAANGVVYLERMDGGAAAAAAAPARTVMDQKNLAFVPAVLPIVRGTVVEFTNSDDVQHNVFTPSALAGKFDLGTSGPGTTRTVTFTEPGDVLILCNIHMEMEAHILVLDTPSFSLVAADGGYVIRDVPPGTYTLKIWRRRWLPFTETVVVPATGDVTLDVDAGG